MSKIRNIIVGVIVAFGLTVPVAPPVKQINADWIVSVASAEPAADKFTSGENRVDLLELYTSQGCSSCPPAERWLSGLKQQTDLAQKIIPLAFHVTYWDYIGWKDRYGDTRYDNRQRQIAHAVEGVALDHVVIDRDELRVPRYVHAISVARDPTAAHCVAVRVVGE